VRLGEQLHLLEGLLVELQRQVKGLGDGLIGDVVVTRQLVSNHDWGLLSYVGPIPPLYTLAIHRNTDGREC
jgi:hypothetical protein